MIRRRLSAVINVYNSEQYISDALRSVIYQSLPADEIIVVDDGSTDGTADCISKFINKDIRYIYQSNQGPSAARNRGIQETTGEYIAFLDSDDLWLEDKNQVQMDFLSSHSDVYLVSGIAWWWDIVSGRRWLDPFKMRKYNEIQRDILIENIVGNPSMVMLKRVVLDKIGLFNPQMRWGEDWDLWIRIISKFNVVILPNPAIVYRSHPISLSQTDILGNINRSWTISSRAIMASKPFWCRPIARTRAWSHFALQRAMYAHEYKNSKKTQLAYAIGALISYPFDRWKKKFRILIQAIIGNKSYRTSKTKMKSWMNGK